MRCVALELFSPATRTIRFPTVVITSQGGSGGLGTKELWPVAAQARAGAELGKGRGGCG